MKQLQYIGPKQDGERHLREQTGIEWFPGEVHGVSEQHAEEFLKHPTSWREVAAKRAALATAAAPATDHSPEPLDALPDWAKKGIELGATDDQLEAIAQAGGPETEQGAALWQDATGEAWTSASMTAPPPVKKATAPAKKPAAKKAAKKKPAVKRAKKAAE